MTGFVAVMSKTRRRVSPLKLIQVESRVVSKELDEVNAASFWSVF